MYIYIYINSDNIAHFHYVLFVFFLASVKIHTRKICAKNIFKEEIIYIYIYIYKTFTCVCVPFKIFLNALTKMLQTVHCTLNYLKIDKISKNCIVYLILYSSNILILLYPSILYQKYFKS